MVLCNGRVCIRGKLLIFNFNRLDICEALTAMDTAIATTSIRWPLLWLLYSTGRGLFISTYSCLFTGSDDRVQTILPCYQPFKTFGLSFLILMSQIGGNYRQACGSKYGRRDSHTIWSSPSHLLPRERTRDNRQMNPIHVLIFIFKI